MNENGLNKARSILKKFSSISSWGAAEDSPRGLKKTVSFNLNDGVEELLSNSGKRHFEDKESEVEYHITKKRSPTVTSRKSRFHHLNKLTGCFGTLKSKTNQAFQNSPYFMAFQSSAATTSEFSCY